MLVHPGSCWFTPVAQHVVVGVYPQRGLEQGLCQHLSPRLGALP